MLHSVFTAAHISTPHSTKFTAPFYPAALMRGNLNFLLFRLKFDFLRFHHVYNVKFDEFVIIRGTPSDIMIETYFQYQAKLAATESALECPQDCNASGCWRGDVIVEVSLFDLIRLSQVLDNPVSALFFNHCYLGLQASDLNPRYHRLIIKLKKPCYFLEKSRCAVHSSKPLHCILFPEYHQISGHWSKLAKSPVFRSFPCIKNKILVSEQRGRALKELRKISSREEACSYDFLFGLPSFIVDSKPLTTRLKQAYHKDRAITLKDHERLVGEKLKSTGFLDSIVAKISQLDTRKTIESLILKIGTN